MSTTEAPQTSATDAAANGEGPVVGALGLGGDEFGGVAY